jgi:hypothetical protein
MPDCQECGGPFTPKRVHGRFCGDYCRIKWNRRNARHPAEPTAASREAARDLAYLVGARQAGKITHGQFAAAAVHLIGTRFATVNDALIALAELAWQGIEHATTTVAEERENA